MKPLAAYVFVTLLALSSVAGAQSQNAIPRVGFLSSLEPEVGLDPFREGLRGQGYVEGRNIAIEARLAIRQPHKLADAAVELVRSGVDVIVAGGSDATQAAQRATKTIPIVMVSAADPVGSGFVRNLARPEGNITGPAGMSVEQGAKRVQLIRELLPDAKRIVVLTHARNPSHPPAVRSLASAARKAGLELIAIEAVDAKGLEEALAAVAKVGPQGMIVLADNMLFNQRDRILRMAAKQRIADVYWRSEWADDGGLASFGTNNPALYKRAAVYVERLLKGAKTVDLPVEIPSRFEFVINLKSAESRGINVPQAVLVQADRVVQ